MKAGVIGTINGSIDEITDFTDYREYGDEKLRQQYEFESPRNTKTGITFYPGRAAIERIEEKDYIDFKEGGIIATQREEKTQYYTEFVLVQDNFVIVESSAGEFLFDLLATQTGTEVERANIDLYDLLEHSANFEPDPWQVGFYGNDGKAEKGVLYGSNILEDSDVGKTLKNTKKNQIGLEILNEEDVNIKFTATESGYLEIYLPDNYDTSEFIDFISNFILPNLK